MRSVRLRVHFTLSQCALVYNTCHRSTNAFALAQVVPQNRFPCDALSLPLSLYDQSGVSSVSHAPKLLPYQMERYVTCGDLLIEALCRNAVAEHRTIAAFSAEGLAEGLSWTGQGAVSAAVCQDGSAVGQARFGYLSVEGAHLFCLCLLLMSLGACSLQEWPYSRCFACSSWEVVHVFVLHGFHRSDADPQKWC